MDLDLKFLFHWWFVAGLSVGALLVGTSSGSEGDPGDFGFWTVLLILAISLCGVLYYSLKLRGETVAVEVFRQCLLWVFTIIWALVVGTVLAKVFIGFWNNGATPAFLVAFVFWLIVIVSSGFILNMLREKHEKRKEGS